MKLYHGSPNPDLKIRSVYPSRYGVTAFFATPDRTLAENYAKYYNGSLYEIEMLPSQVSINFELRDTYNSVIRDYVKEYSKMPYPSIKFLNCLDRPAPGFPQCIADVVCIFKTSAIISITKIHTF